MVFCTAYPILVWNILCATPEPLSRRLGICSSKLRGKKLRQIRWDADDRVTVNRPTETPCSAEKQRHSPIRHASNCPHRTGSRATRSAHVRATAWIVLPDLLLVGVCNFTSGILAFVLADADEADKPSATCLLLHLRSRGWSGSDDVDVNEHPFLVRGHAVVPGWWGHLSVVDTRCYTSSAPPHRLSCVCGMDFWTHVSFSIWSSIPGLCNQRAQITGKG